MIELSPKVSNNMRIRVLMSVAILLLAFPLIGPLCLAQRRKRSTPEDRAKAVQFAHRLETNPLGEDAQKARKWLDKWIREVADFSVPSCGHLPENAGKAKPKYAAELAAQMRASIAAFIIEFPDQAEDPNDRIRAGTIGMLKAYESILKVDRKARWDFLDSLSEKQSRNELDKDIRAVMARCSDVPLSDVNKNSYQAGDVVYAPIEVSKAAEIMSKPEPQYPDEARAKNIQGTVVLQIVLASSGKVTDLEVLKGLPYGLTEHCIASARRIKFEPALKSGRPVSTLVRVEYHFMLG